jgi:hypothetical protein
MKSVWFRRIIIIDSIVLSNSHSGKASIEAIVIINQVALKCKYYPILSN